jgi:hypothetical protein
MCVKLVSYQNYTKMHGQKKNMCAVAGAMEVRPSVVLLERFSCLPAIWVKRQEIQHTNSVKLSQASSCIR